MDFWLTVLVLLRRWYVTLPAFCAALGAAAAVYSTVPAVYTSNAAMVLTLPRTGASLPVHPGTTNAPVNPLLNFDRGLTMTASILTARLTTARVGQELGVLPGGDTLYKVHNGSANVEALATGPFVFVEGEARTPEAATDIVRKVAARARLELLESQRAVDAPPATYMVLTDVVAPTPAERLQGRKLRSAAVALALGLVASLCAGYAAESLAQARSRRGTGTLRPPLTRLRPPPPVERLNGHAGGERHA
ncbi:hypothetical protein [Nonomuraea lactucae]|uniref:hypothetical protein n=1 Tax=Nonomuraea lactucae TaxID=2249762 RepID=UPI000DE205AF|nr:hypothetical protein [Nonomuraea lactucae]